MRENIPNHQFTTQEQERQKRIFVATSHNDRCRRQSTWLFFTLSIFLISYYWFTIRLFDGNIPTSLSDYNNLIFHRSRYDRTTPTKVELQKRPMWWLLRTLRSVGFNHYDSRTNHPKSEGPQRTITNDVKRNFSNGTKPSSEQQQQQRRRRRQLLKGDNYIKNSIGLDVVPTPRIIGGSVVPSPDIFPFFAFPAGKQLCGATLIHTDILLTAAHCKGAFKANGAMIGGTQLDASESQYSNVDKELPHPDYEPGTEDNDIMLVRLTSYLSTEQVVLNFDSIIPDVGETVTVIGFGFTAPNGTFSDQLLQTTVNVVPFEQCNDYFGSIDNTTMICAGSATGQQDSCKGDSGGPLLTSTKVQIGIVSFGDGCAKPGIAAVYTRISAYEKWITQGICDLSDDPPADCVFTPTTASPTRSPYPTFAFPDFPASIVPSITPNPTTTVNAPRTAVPIAPTTSRPSVVGSIKSQQPVQSPSSSSIKHDEKKGKLSKSEDRPSMKSKIIKSGKGRHHNYSHKSSSTKFPTTSSDEHSVKRPSDGGGDSKTSRSMMGKIKKNSSSDKWTTTNPYYDLAPGSSSSTGSDLTAQAVTIQQQGIMAQRDATKLRNSRNNNNNNN